ncbi:ABC transporter ATP-binding protein [Limoniibacter endophyticus]|uniref:ABC transporter ATP-binding protein n=1 Tax=Limoniibacter endophyticus TaxID=1565040 RepID=A0A8J3DV27_9HYPH|nr:ABC transporter ATP-binding protein [Limoniibacter endophyticus]GHC80103.1 ABC transporter ATP-binding protein [Limoniibacter endophyticus]
MTALRLENFSCGYGLTTIVQSADLTLVEGRVTCLFGRNGAGKTTLLRGIMGLASRKGGIIRVQGTDIVKLETHEIAAHRIAYVPQGRRLFAELTVDENLEIGLMARSETNATRDSVLSRFPVLRERLSQRAGSLSGGEQQMLAIARALAIDPAVLLLDEPTEGLMPSMIDAIRQIVRELAAAGVAVLLVEQRIDAVLSVADSVIFMENGRTRPAVSPAELAADEDLVKRFMGV